MTYFVASFACLAGNPISGALIQGGGGEETADAEDYRYMQVFSAVVVAVGLVFFVAVRIFQKRELWVKV